MLVTKRTSKIQIETLLEIGTRRPRMDSTDSSFPMGRRPSLTTITKSSAVTRVALLLLAIVVVNYWPMFLGSVPLPTDLITQFPPFDDYRVKSNNIAHAELGDIITQFYPWREYAAENIRHGVVPLWNPYLLAGAPFQANMQSAVFYPLNFVFVLLPMPMAWSVSLMLKVFLAALFTFLFLQEIGTSVCGSVVGATAFALGGFMTAWLGWAHTDSSLWLPLICFQMQRLHRNPEFWNAAVLSVFLAMPVLAGHPGMAAHVVATAAAYGVWLLVWPHSSSKRRYGLWLLSGTCLGVGIAAVQIVPSIEWLRYTFRTLDLRWDPLPLSHALSFFSRDVSTQPNSAGFLVPQGAAYVGALCLLTATFASFHANRREWLFFTTVFVLSFSVVYGVYPFINLSQTLPIFDGLKKEEALMLTEFALAVLAGLGASWLESFQWRNSTTTKRWVSVGILLLATASFHTGTAVLSRMTKPGVVWWRSPRSFRVLLVLSAFIVALRIFQFLSQRQWVVLAVLLATVDLVSFSYGHIPFNSTETIFPKVPLFDFLSARPRPFRVVSLDLTTPPNVELPYGLPTAGGYDFMQKRLMMLAKDLIEYPSAVVSFRAQGIVDSRNNILDLLNVKYLIAAGYNRSSDLLRTQPQRFQEVWSANNVSVFENKNVIPRAFLVPQNNIETILTDEAQLARLSDTSFNPYLNVILSDRVTVRRGTEANLSPGIQGDVIKYDEGMNWVHIQVNAAVPSVLVLSQIYYPGWTVDVDKTPSELLRPDYAFVGTTVDAGTHDLEFRFRPPSFIVGAIVSLISLLLIAVVRSLKLMSLP